MRVLVVDDCQIIREVLKRLLEKLGVQADFAENGAEGVSKAGTTAYDLVFMDMHMPVLDGMRAVQFIRKTGASQRSTIVALTGKDDDEARLQSLGFSRYMRKPPAFNVLAALVAAEQSKLQPQPHA